MKICIVLCAGVDAGDGRRGASYSDGGDSFTLKYGNSFFDPHLKTGYHPNPQP